MPIPARGQVWAVKQRETSVGDRLVLLFEDVSKRPQVLLVGLVVHVALEARHLPRRYRCHEDLLGMAGSSLEVVNVALHRFEVLPGDRAVALGTRWLIEARTPEGGVLGEVEHVPTGVGRRRLALETGETIYHVGRVVRFTPLAIIDDVKAYVPLLADALADGCAHARVEGLPVLQTALFSGHQHLKQVIGARQAAAVRGQDAVRAPASSASFLSAVLRAAQGASRLVGVQRTVSRLDMCAPIRYGSYPILSGAACPALEGVIHFRTDDATLEVWNANSTREALQEQTSVNLR